MDVRLPTPISCIQHQRFVDQEGWLLRDLTLGYPGSIVVAGSNGNVLRTLIDLYAVNSDVDSREKPSLVYSKEFEKYSTKERDYLARKVAFLVPDCNKLVTCLGDKIYVVDVNKDEILRSRQVKGETYCLYVKEKSVFVGFWESNTIFVYSTVDLTEIRSIILEGIGKGDWPHDITVKEGKIFACVGHVDERSDQSSQIFDEENGKFMCSLAHPSGTHWYARSLAVNVPTGIIAVVWNNSFYRVKGERWQVVMYHLKSEPIQSFLIFDVECGVTRIRIFDSGDRTVTGNLLTGEVKIYDTAELLTYGHLKEGLASQLHRDDCLRLATFFGVFVESDKPVENIFLALEEKDIIQQSNVERLKEAFLKLDVTSSCYLLTDTYQKTRRQATIYNRFLATLSTHLTGFLPRDICDYFKLSNEKKTNITSSDDPGLSLLLALDEVGIIRPSDVEDLQKPLEEFQLVQAVAKIKEYQSKYEERMARIHGKVELAEEDKKKVFIHCLKTTIERWYETMTPVPWKKSCRWKSTDLFISRSLILTNSKNKRNLRGIDEKCMIACDTIFSHEKVKSEKRIILEGDPGSGKTMLMSQLAYDWSQGKFQDIEMLILLPLKLVQQKSVCEAIKEFYLPEESRLSIKDVESILRCEENCCHLLLDGFEEYTGKKINDEEPDVMKIMTKAKYPHCKVVITSRSDYVQNLPKYPMLKLRQFGENDRNLYIERVFSDNLVKHEEVRTFISNSSFMLDLCTTPLLFVMAVHNIGKMQNSEISQIRSISPFMREMIDTLCSTSHLKEQTKPSSGIESNVDNAIVQTDLLRDTAPSDKITSSKEEAQSDLLPKEGTLLEAKHPIPDSQESELEATQKMSLSLEELAFNGLCRGFQQLSWQKGFVEKNVTESKKWVACGLLVTEERLVTLSESNIHNPAKENSDEEAGVVAKSLMDSTKEESIPNPMDSQSVETKIPVKGKVPKTRGPFQPEIEKPQNKDIETRSTEIMSQVSLEVKFLHKLIQEWFAAKRLSSLIWESMSSDVVQKCVNKHLQDISPADLHYVLRFTCFLCPPSFHFIVKYLLQNYQSGLGYVDDYILDCIFLCFAEYIGEETVDTIEAIADICSENISVRGEDSRFLQQAKINLLEKASNKGIPIKRLILTDVIKCASYKGKTLLFSSGVVMNVLKTLEILDVSRWDQTVEIKNCPSIVKFISKCSSVKEARICLPYPPPELNQTNIKWLPEEDQNVTWFLGQKAKFKLDKRKGEWMVKPNSEGDIGYQGLDYSTVLSVARNISKEGGFLRILDTDVTLEVPPDALEDDREHCLVQIRIIPPESFKTLGVRNFSSDSAVTVELLPNHLKFKRAVKLTLPHCLKLKKGVQHKAKVFMSHHEGEMEPDWVEQTDLHCKLDDDICTIELRSFCWVKIEIDNAVVEAKRIKVFTAAKPIVVPDDIAEVEFGYHPDLPGAGEIFRDNPSWIVGQKKPYWFHKEGSHPLKVTLKEAISRTWRYTRPKDNPKEISFQDISQSNEFSCPFVLEQDDKGYDVPTCVFKAAQNGRDIELILRPEKASVEVGNRSSAATSSSNSENQQGSSPEKEFSRLLARVALKLNRDNCNILAMFFNFEDAEFDNLQSGTPGISLLRLLRSRNEISAQNVTKLQSALEELGLREITENLLKPYQTKVDQRSHGDG